MYLLYIFRQASMTSWLATRYVRGSVAQVTTRLTMNQKIAGSSPARILCGKDLDRLVWQVDQLQVKRSCGAMDSTSDYESEDCRFESCQNFMLQGFRQASMASWPATTNVRGPVAQWTMRLTTSQKIGSSPARIIRVLCGKDLDRLVWQADRLQLMSEVLCCNLQWTMRLTMNQKIAGTVNTLTVLVTNCMGTVNTLSVPIQYTF